MKKWIIYYTIFYTLAIILLFSKLSIHGLYITLLITCITYSLSVLLLSYITFKSVSWIENLNIHIVFIFFIKIIFSICIGIIFLFFAISPSYILDYISKGF